MTVMRQPTANNQSWEFEQPIPRGVIAAVDESPESLDAFRMASEIAARRKWALHAISVISPLPSRKLLSDPTEDLPTADLIRLDLRYTAVADLLSATRVKRGYTYEVAVGPPARLIVSSAECRGSELIVVGRTRHNPLDRFIGNETTLEIMRISQVPVLAVPCFTELRRVVAAIDCSESSVKAALLASQAIDPSGTLHLVYVDEPQDVIAGVPVTPLDRSPSDIVAWFRRTTALINSSATLRIEPTVLVGKPADVLLEFAERVGANMITAGSHGYSRVARFLLGSVSTALVRRSPIPILVARSLV